MGVGERVDVGSVREERGDDGDVPVGSGFVECGVVVLVGLVDGGGCGEEVKECGKVADCCGV